MSLVRGLLLFLALTAGLRADDAPSPPVTDPAAVRQAYHAMLARPEFREQLDDSTGGMRWGDWMSQWLSHLIARFQDYKYAGRISGLAWLLVIAFTVLAVAGSIYAVVRLSRRKRGEADDGAAPVSGHVRLLSPRQYEARLREALEHRDWHGAWLAAWLQLLARLETRHLVDADRSQTNREYLAQLRTQALPVAALPLIAGLVDDYDRFIYGRRAIDEAGWRAFRERINEVTLMLNLRERATEEAA